MIKSSLTANDNILNFPSGFTVSKSSSSSDVKDLYFIVYA